MPAGHLLAVFVLKHCPHAVGWSLGLAGALLACVHVHGCSSGGPYQSPAASQAMAKIRIGMPRQDVIVLLGEPVKKQSFGKIELLTYQPDCSLGNPSEHNPIAIEDGKVSGFGLTYATKAELEFKAKTGGN